MLTGYVVAPGVTVRRPIVGTAARIRTIVLTGAVILARARVLIARVRTAALTGTIILAGAVILI